MPNRFAGLSMEDEADDDGNEYEDIHSDTVARPIESGPARLSLQELIAGTDRADSIVFLMTLDELMQVNIGRTSYSDLWTMLRRRNGGVLCAVYDCVLYEDSAR
jgi:hypothetical protein